MLQPLGPAPYNFIGFWPAEDYLLQEVAESLETNLDRANFIEMCRRFGIDPDNPPAGGPVYVVYHRHWAAGRLRLLLVSHDAPPETLQLAKQILSELESYPVLNDDLYSELQFEAAVELWESMSEDERAEYRKLDPDSPIPEPVYELVK